MSSIENLSIPSLAEMHKALAEKRESSGKIYAKWMNRIFGLPEKEMKHEIDICYDYATKTNDELNLTIAHRLFAHYNFATGNYAASAEYEFKSLLLYEQQNNEWAVVHGYLHLATNYTILKLYEKAMDCLVEAKQRAEKIGNEKLLASVYGETGIFFQRINYVSRAAEYYQRAIDTLKGDAKYDIAVHFHNAGQLYLFSKEYDKAEKNLLHALEIEGDAETLPNKCNIRLTLCQLYLEKGDLNKSFHFAEEGMRFARLTGSDEYLKYALTYFASVYSAQHQPEKAKQSLLEALALITSESLRSSSSDIYKGLANIFRMEGNFEEAFHYSNLLNENEAAAREDNLKAIHRALDTKENLQHTERKKTEAEEFAAAIAAEKRKSDELLLNILPAEVAEELKANGKAEAKHFDNVTVMFTDFKGFTRISEQLSPQQLVDELHCCFKAFDEIISNYSIEKIKTVGDAYIAVCGLPLPDENHALKILNAAVEIRNFMLQRKEKMGDKTFEIRIGINSGSVVAGIVGVKKFAYDIWGDTVNTAARMEQNSEAGKINISETTYHLLTRDMKNTSAFTYRGEIEAKNKGKMKMYFAD